METGKAFYLVRYYGYLMTMQERIAYRHLQATAKATHGRTDMAAQSELENSSRPNHLRRMLSDDPEVLRLTKEGLPAFVVATAQRILDENLNKIRFNHCNRCGGLARTPRARQCRFCGFDWHGANF